MVVAVKLTSTRGVIELTQVDSKGRRGEKELKNCLTSFVKVPTHTPILGKTQSIRKIYLYNTSRIIFKIQLTIEHKNVIRTETWCPNKGHKEIQT